ncbi:MAG: hypothetical protein ACRDSP_18015 [Pseudonocardiaceae bacterium]
MKIELHIDRVLLDGIGVSPRHVRALREALHTELTRLITEAPRTTWQQSRRRRRITTPAITVPRTGTPSAIGRQVARAVHGGLLRSGSREVPR